MSVTAPIICDTSGLVAAADVTDPDHAAAKRIVEIAEGSLVLSPLIVAEADHLLCESGYRPTPTWPCSPPRTTPSC